jgi:DNA-binding MarR family transcriptional regulator
VTEHVRSVAANELEPAPAADARQLWRAVARLHGEILQQLEQELRPATGLPVVELEALHELSDAPGTRLQLHQLATRLGFSRSAATRLVDRLQRGGYVEREVSATDKRATLAVLTPKGERLLEDARELYDHVLHYALLRHHALEGLVVYTTTELPSSTPRWYRMHFGPPVRRIAPLPDS